MALRCDNVVLADLPPPYAGVANMGHRAVVIQGETIVDRQDPLSLLIYVVVLIVVIVVLFRVLGLAL